MSKVIGFLVGGVLFFSWRPIVALVAAIWLVNINGGELYAWLDGFGHGIFFLPNLVRHLFGGDVLFKAANHTVGYDVSWWIATIGSCIGWMVDACFSFMKVWTFVSCEE